MRDFIDELLSGMPKAGGNIDTYLGGKELGPDFESVRVLARRIRQVRALTLPVPAGTRVSYAGNLGALLSLDDAPAPGTQGTVVTAKTSGGLVTAYEGRVFVKFDDGKLRTVSAEFLREVERNKTASTIRVGSLEELLRSFSKVSSNVLIHKSEKDLWSFSRNADGSVSLSRLFDESGEPLKMG